MRAPRRVVIDTESSVIVPMPGMNAPRGDKDVCIIDIGMVEMFGNEMTGRSLRIRIRPTVSGHFDAYSVRTHGVLPKDLVLMPNFRESYEEIEDFISGDRIFAHEARSDMAVLNAEMARTGLPEMARDRFFDTIPLVKKSFPGMSPGLDSVYEEIFGSVRSGYHGALKDAIMLAECLEVICPETDAALDRVLSGTRAPHYLREPRPHDDLISGPG